MSPVWRPRSLEHLACCPLTVENMNDSPFGRAWPHNHSGEHCPLVGTGKLNKLPTSFQLPTWMRCSRRHALALTHLVQDKCLIDSRLHGQGRELDERISVQMAFFTPTHTCLLLLDDLVKTRHLICSTLTAGHETSLPLITKSGS